MIVKDKKILFIAPSNACTSRSGGGQRTNLIYNILQKFGEVDVILLGGGDINFFTQFFPEVNSLQLVNILNPGEVGFWRLLRPIKPQIIDNLALAIGSRSLIYQPDVNLEPVVKDLLEKNHYDLIVGRYLRNIAKAGVLTQTSVPVILDYDDPDNQTLLARLSQPGLNFLFRRIIISHLKQIEKLLPQLLPSAQHIWVTNQNDQKLVNHPAVSILPNIPYPSLSGQPSEFTPINPDSRIILFVGIYGHRVNKDGVKRFIVNHWSNIRQVVKDAELRIVGTGPWSDLESELGVIPGVKYVGFVENLTQEYSQTRFTIVPLFEGGGTKIKVIESLYYGRTAVVTYHAHHGYENLPDEQALLVANTESEFTDKCIRLLNDSDLCNKLAQEGQQLVADGYSFGRFESIVEETLKSICLD